jgi:glycosyltransferase 2 family protein
VTPGRSLLWRVAGALFVAASLAFLVSRLVQDWDEVQAAAAQVSPGLLVLSFLAAAAGLASTALAWRTLLSGLGSRLPMVTAGQVFFLSQIGKYLPGSVWPYLAQVRLGKELGVPVARSAQAGVTFVLLHLVTGLVLGLPRLLLGERLDERFALSLWAVPVLLVVLHPAVLGRLTAWAARVMRVEAPAARIPWPSLVAAVGWILAAWLLYGVSLAMLVAPFEPLTLPGIGLLTSAFALAWSVGFLGAALVVIAAPAGLGFREIALYATLAGVVSPGPAALVVVASRVVMTLGDLAWALLSGARRSVSRRAPA